jgi:hypothetical protein
MTDAEKKTPEIACGSVPEKKTPELACGSVPSSSVLQEARHDIGLGAYFLEACDALYTAASVALDSDVHTLGRVTVFERLCLHFRLCVDPNVCTCLDIPPWLQVRACVSFKEMFSFLVLRHVMAPREILQQHFSAYSKLTLLCKCGLDDVKQLASGSFYVELDMTYAFMPASASAPRYGDAFAFKYTSCGVCNKEDVNHVACLELLGVFLLLDADGVRLNYATASEIACGLQEVKEIANRMTDAERKTLELACGGKMSEELVEKATTCRLMRDRVFATWPFIEFLAWALRGRSHRRTLRVVTKQ